MKHLRYLEIFGGGAGRELPESIVLLYNLQTLRIKNSSIEVLPKNIRELVSLRHLEFSYIMETPPCLSELTQLQTLSSFVVSREKGCSIAELEPLKNLKGSLELYGLEQVESKEEARRTNFLEKVNLEQLEFNWPSETKNEIYNSFEVLEGLQPHKNLQTLNIYDFPGKCLPNKIFVENLRAIELYSCRNCERLPMLGQLDNLKKLYIVCLDSVRSVGDEFYGGDSKQIRTTFFSKLEIFHISFMDNLEQWEEMTTIASSFPQLKHLEIIRCPKLLNIPDVFGYCDENDHVEHLETLEIANCDKLTKLPNGLQICHSIQSLWISGCIEKFDLSSFKHHSSLKNLSLEDDGNSTATQLPD